MSKEYTLSTLLSELEDKYSATKRPKRYFDVKKRGKLSKKEVSYVKKRFKELIDREKCVKKDPDNPKCYEKVSTDKKPRMKKRRSSYLKDYEEIFGPRKDKSWKDTYSSELSKLKKKHKRAPLGLLRIAVETGLPYTAIKEVYDIGVGAYASSGSRPGMSGEQWGYGRVYAFIMSYFFNEDGRYDDQRFFQNKSDFHVLEKILRKNPATDYSKFNPRNIPPEDIEIIYHSSPSDTLHQEKLDWSYGPFDGVLFFALSPYSLGPVKGVYAYLINKNNVIEVPDLFDAYYSGELDPITKRKVELEVDTFAINISLEEPYDFDTLADILSLNGAIGYDDLEEYGLTYTGGGDTDIYALGWYQQASQARIGKILGYEAVEGIDEQGTVFMIDMLDGSNKNLVLIDEEDFDEGELYDALRLKKNPATEGSCEEDWANLRDYYTQSFEQNKHDFAELISDLSGNVKGSKPLNPRDIVHLGYETRLSSNVYADQLLTQLMEDIYFRYESNEDLQELVSKIQSYNRYGNVKYSDVINQLKHYIPPIFGMPAVRFLTKPFYFVHFTGQYNVKMIESKGFKGREHISTLYSTKASSSEYSYESGYVFGYLLKSTSHGDALDEVLELATTYGVSVPSGDYDPHWSVTSASFVIAVASRGLEIYHSMDKENQLIVPVSCIDSRNIVTYPKELENELDDMQEGPLELYFDDPDEYYELYDEDWIEYDEEDE